MIKNIEQNENAKMVQYTDGTFKVLYNHFIADDMFGIYIADQAAAVEMFNLINMAGLTRQELEAMGFEA